MTRPVRGRVKTANRCQMEIQLPSGGIVQASRRPELGVGDTCWITWDYTRSRLRMVLTEAEYHSNSDGDEELEEPCLGDDSELDLPPDSNENNLWFL